MTYFVIFLSFRIVSKAAKRIVQHYANAAEAPI